ncbi:hypothetical protein BD408DRAFT_415770 [Parasitella parasitica]|nr:hypothetical protein BD408DRAFT_415770 [Parasitella parasitica]
MEFREYRIIQASTKALLFRKCECGGYTTPVIINDLVFDQEIFYCHSKCKKIITEFKIAYKLPLIVLNTMTSKLESIVAYDDTVADFIGCLPKQYLKYLKEDNLLSRKLEEALVGISCAAKLDRKRGNDQSTKAKKLLILTDGEKINLIDIIRNGSDDIHFGDDDEDDDDIS